MNDVEVEYAAKPHIRLHINAWGQWWAEQWPEGAAYVAGLVAQDVQDALFEKVGRWPMCLECDDGPAHSLYIQPDLGGPDPVWVCEESGQEVAPLGRL